MQTTIQVHGLHKSFGATQALDGLDLNVRTGEVHGLLGPNGAGKSTTIRILLGLMRKDAGDTRLFDADPWHDAVRLHRRLAYVPDDVRLWPNLTGGEAIDLFTKLRGGHDPDRREALLERFKLDPTKKCGSYSRGNRQKVAIVAAFASDVDLYLLDEPTTGLDPLMMAEFRRTVRETHSAGKTVLLSSHIFADVEALCDRVTIIRDGQVVETGTLDGLRHLTRTTITVKTEKSPKAIAKKRGILNYEEREGEARFEVEPEYLGHALRYLSGVGVKSITSHPPTLEELFMRHYSEKPQVRRGRAE